MTMTISSGPAVSMEACGRSVKPLLDVIGSPSMLMSFQL
jgi:hypothetical protein